MNEIDIVKMLMREKGKSSAFIAEALGYKHASAISNRLQSKTMTVEVLLNILSVLDCELIIKDKVGSKGSFTVLNENRQSVKIYSKKGDEE